MIGRYFHFDEMGTTIRTEIIAGFTTFMAMAYIIFVQPAVLQVAGMDFDAVFVATCISSFVATLIMGVYANYPIALAPGMGENFFFVYTVVLTMGLTWQAALGAVLISGIVFVILTFLRIREMIINAIPESLKHGIAGGIGLFIAFIGFVQAGIIIKSPGGIVSLGNLHSPPVLLAIIGIFIISILLALRIKGGILIGIITTALIGVFMGVVKFQGIASLPPTIAPTFFKLDLVSTFKLGGVTVILIFLFMDMFDTIGTLVGVGTATGFIKDGKLPRANKALLADATGTIFGAVLGTSTVTSYIESTAGVSSGGRTGFASVVTSLLFLVSLFFAPIIRMIGGGFEVSESVFLYPITAPALIIVGSMMMRTVVKINWEDPSEYIPAFLTLIGMPLTYSIADGLAFGFISYPIVKLISGKGKEVSWLCYLLTLLFILRYIFLPH
ncbi:MAG: NCS2 family permease [Candidatus Cloacimonadota bacterium]|nr:MAG: NCS2 family permease [Candidatus Cloacimonadota bacterium]